MVVVEVVVEVEEVEVERGRVVVEGNGGG